MSYVEGPKSRFTAIIPEITPSVHSSFRLKPGCVQCGSLLDISSQGTANFSGKCFSCEHWISDEDEVFDEWED